MFKNVVLAFDGSDYSNKALQCGKSIAERFDATLYWVMPTLKNFLPSAKVPRKLSLMRHARNWAPQLLL